MDAVNERLAEATRTTEEWRTAEIETEDDAEDIAGFKKQLRAIDKDAEAIKDNICRPLRTKINDATAVYTDVKTKIAALTAIIDRKILAYRDALKAKQEAEAKAAREAAEKAAREAEEAAQRALRNGSVYAQEDALEAAKAAADAEKVAKDAARAEVKIGGTSTVNGAKRSLAFKKTEKLVIEDPYELIKFLKRKKVDLTRLSDELRILANAYRKNHPDEVIPGTRVETVEQVI